MTQKQNAVLRKIDIKNWGSEASRQHRIQSIPQLRLYDGEKLVTADPGQVLDWLAQ